MQAPNKFLTSMAQAVIGAAFAVLLPNATLAQTPSWNLYGGTTSVFVPYTNGATNAGLNNPPTVNLGFNSTTNFNQFVMDTGSTGIVASPDRFIPAPGAQDLGPGTQLYSSSGIIENGTWYSSTENIYNSAGKLVATADAPVLQVTSITCAPNPRDCTATNSPTGIGLMGIGFARESPQQPRGTPPYNAFTNLTGVVGATGTLQPLPANWSNGYVITPNGAYLGLTAADTANAGFVKLASTTYVTSIGTVQDWSPAPMTVSLNGVSGNGNVLMDTGVTVAYLTPPPGASAGTLVTCPSTGLVECAPAGTVISLALPGQPNPVAYYGYTVGQNGNPMQPGEVVVDYGLAGGTFLNTSAHVLGGINFIFDATNGYIGYQWNGGSSDSVGYVTPMLALQGSAVFPGNTAITMPTYLFGATNSPPTVQLSSPGQVTMAGPISSQTVCGSGGCAATGLEIAGGTFILTANNTYQGTSVIDPGATLALSGTGSIASSSGVAANGAFDISGTTAGATIAALSGSGVVNLGGQALTVSNATGVFSGAIADGGLNGGTGGALTIAAGTQVLAGTNTYTGATTINSGATLALAGAGSIAASSGVTANGLFDISATAAGASITSLAGSGAVNLGGQSLTLSKASGTFSGVIGGSGGLIVAGGSQTLTGSNTYAGGTTIAGGATLAISGDTALGATTGGLTFNGGTLLALSSFTSLRPIIVGAAGGTVTGGSGLPVSLYGPVSINGSFTAPSLLIGGSGTLRGTGTINTPTAVNGQFGTRRQPGTLTFTAPVTLAATSVTQLDIDGTGTGTGAGNYSRVIVTGAGNTLTSGGTLLPLLRGITGSATNVFTPALGQSFTVVSAAGGLLGSYAGLVQPAGLTAGTRFDAVYAPNTLSLVVTPALYGDLAMAGVPETAGQIAVGSALDAVRPGAGIMMSAAQSAIYTPLYSLSGAAIGQTLDQLGPTIYGDALMVDRNNWYLIAGAITEQLEARRGARPGDTAQMATGPNGSTIWLTGLGQFDSVGSNGAPGYSSSTGGLATGIDMAVTPVLTVGAAFGFTNQSTSAKNSASFTGDALQFELYGSLRQGIAFAELQGGGLFSEGTATRPLYAYGVQARGDTNGSAGGGSLRAGVRLDMAAWHIEPSLMIGGVSVNQGSLTETEGGPVGLSVGGETVGSLQTVLGARVERRFALNETLALVPSAQLGWLHEYLDTQASTAAAFIGAPGAGFVVQGAPIGRDAAVVGLRATLETNTPFSVYASYVGTVNGSSNAQTVSAGVRFVW